MTGPAFEARATRQLPVFICAQAENDQPVGTVFPLGDAGHAITEATIGDLEKWCVIHALGFVPDFRAHKLSGPTGNEPFVLTPPGNGSNQSVLGGGSREGSDRRTRRDLAGAVPSVHREPRVSACEGVKEGTGRRRCVRGAERRRRTLRRPRVIREIHRPDRTWSASIGRAATQLGCVTRVTDLPAKGRYEFTLGNMSGESEGEMISIFQVTVAPEDAVAFDDSVIHKLADNVLSTSTRFGVLRKVYVLKSEGPKSSRSYVVIAQSSNFAFPFNEIFHRDAVFPASMKVTSIPISANDVVPGAFDQAAKWPSEAPNI